MKYFLLHVRYKWLSSVNVKTTSSSAPQGRPKPTHYRTCSCLRPPHRRTSPRGACLPCTLRRRPCPGRCRWWWWRRHVSWWCPRASTTTPTIPTGVQTTSRGSPTSPTVTPPGRSSWETPSPSTVPSTIWPTSRWVTACVLDASDIIWGRQLR